MRRLADDYLRTLRIHGVTPRAGTGRPGARRLTVELAPGQAVAFGRDLRLPLTGQRRSNGNSLRGQRSRATVTQGNGHAPATRAAGDRGTSVSRRGERLRPGRILRQVRRLPERGRGARPDVAPAERRGAPPRPLRLAAPPGPGGQGRAQPRRAASAPAPRSAALDEIPWTAADLALIDEARVLLGPRRPRTGAGGGGPSTTSPRTYGHIVVDEAQDLSPMQLRISGAPLTVGLDHHGRRHRPGHRARGPRPAGTRSPPTCPASARPDWSS